MCMQCVAQGAPMVGVAVTVLNRRNLKTWLSTTWQKAHRPADGETAPAETPASPAPDRVPAQV